MIKAAKEIRRALDLHPKYVHAMITLGEILIHLGQFRDARTLFRQAIDTDPRVRKVAEHWLKTIEGDDP